MSEELEKMCNSLFDQQVPVIWANVGFLSMKPLGSWTQDLTTRIQFLQKWIIKELQMYSGSVDSSSLKLLLLALSKTMLVNM